MIITELITTSWETVIKIIGSGVGIYIAVIALTRISGKRSFSKMSSFDFAMTVAVGSIIASTLISSSVNLIEGAIGLTTVYILQMLVAWARKKTSIEKWVDNTPLLLMNGSTILAANLDKAQVTESDLRSKLREANVTKLSQVKAVVFETTGDISVLHKSDSSELEPWLIKDVASS